jgi:hypothetical protein
VGQVEIQVTRPGARPVQFDQGGRRNAIVGFVLAAIVQIADQERYVGWYALCSGSSVDFSYQ